MCYPTLQRLLLITAAITLLAGCGGGVVSPSPSTSGPSLRAAVVQPSSRESSHRGAPATTSCLTSACVYILNCTSGCGGFGAPSVSILIYPASATGNVKPLKKMSGPYLNYELCGQSGGCGNELAVDAKHNVYTLAPLNGSPAVEMFKAGHYGNVKPMRAISGSLTDLSMPLGVAVDTKGNIYAANSYYADYCFQANGNVTVYKAGSNGNVPPVAIIEHPGVTAVTVDNDGYVYTAGLDILSKDHCVNSIHVYAPSASGYQLVQDITGSNLSNGSSDITVDASKNIWVAQRWSLLMFPAGSNGNAAPSATITGADTGLNASGVALDSAGNIYAGNDINGASIPGSVTVYPAGSNGNVLPVQGIVGPKTKLTMPIGMAVR